MEAGRAIGAGCLGAVPYEQFYCLWKCIEKHIFLSIALRFSTVKNPPRTLRRILRVDKVDTLQVETSFQEFSLENKGFRSHGALRASP